MTAMVTRWYRFRRNQVIIFIVIVLVILYYISLHDGLQREQDLDVTRRPVTLTSSVVAVAKLSELNAREINNRSAIIEYIENRLQEALKEDKGTGCEIPALDPFAPEVTQFDMDLPKIECPGQDWVRCHLSVCKVVKEILDTTIDIQCSYRDIIYESDSNYYLGNPTNVKDNDVYILTRSDHVKVKCFGTHKKDILPSKWIGHAVGYRATVKPQEPPPGREDSINVLFLGFDSTSRNGFIRRMPKSYEYLTKVMGATILNGYNIVGDGTPAALFPILTGKNELELPDVRKKMKNNGTLDNMPFIFYKLKEDGYRTAYFEDMPWIGTFQYRFNGFRHQPADHYLRAFYLEESSSGRSWWKNTNSKYCVGDTPRYKLMLDITDQFFRLDGKKFCFTFIADITHDDFNKISSADDDVVTFLTSFMDQGRHENTLLYVMGDHGPRYAKVRDTLQGKLEERLPLMAVLLPSSLKNARPPAQANLEINANVLTTPHDIHATTLDAMDLRRYWSPFVIRGADLRRGLTLLEEVPKNRSCSEAGIEPHWCACLAWKNVSTTDPVYPRTAQALVDYINKLTSDVRSKCIPRTLTTIEWVMKKQANSKMLSFVEARDADGYVGKFGAKVHVHNDHYQIKIVVGPGRGVYEASLTHNITDDKFDIDTRDISRTNAYNNEPQCISATHPHLNMYCYCND